MIEVRHPQIKILRSGNNVVYCRLLCVPVLFFWEAKQRNIVVGKSVCAAYSCANLPTLRLALSHDAVAVPLVTRGASSGAITDYAPTSSLSKYSLFATTTRSRRRLGDWGTSTVAAGRSSGNASNVNDADTLGIVDFGCYIVGLCDLVIGAYEHERFTYYVTDR